MTENNYKDLFKNEFPSRPLFYLKFREVEVFRSNARLFEYEDKTMSPVGLVNVQLSNNNDE